MAVCNSVKSRSEGYACIPRSGSFVMGLRSGDLTPEQVTLLMAVYATYGDFLDSNWNKCVTKVTMDLLDDLIGVSLGRIYNDVPAVLTLLVEDLVEKGYFMPATPAQDGSAAWHVTLTPGEVTGREMAMAHPDHSTAHHPIIRNTTVYNSGYTSTTLTSTGEKRPTAQDMGFMTAEEFLMA